MASFESFTQQSAFLESLPKAALSATGLFLLGVLHCQTDLPVSTLYPFFLQVQTAQEQGWVTSSEKRQIELQLYAGQLGTAHTLLSQAHEGREIEGILSEEISELPCDLCGQRDLIGAEMVDSGECGHRFHGKCGQAAVRGMMVKGGGEALTCPAVGCKAGLTEDCLQQLFSSDDLIILKLYWRSPHQDTPPTPLICPTFRCKSSTLWRKSQFFSCGSCAVTYCLHCLEPVASDKRGHACGPHTMESVEIGEEFAKGGRFKRCGRCGYWCSVPNAATVVCRCGAEMCGKCVLMRDRCTCHENVFDKILRLSKEIKKVL